jgi:phosphatidylinositol kinase/protein kinase (PI-3  family)
VPVSLKRDIISAMGGQSSEDYKHFRKLAVEAYIILRKHSSLFLTLLSCMAGSPLECFSGDSAAVSLDFALSQVCPWHPGACQNISTATHPCLRLPRHNEDTKAECSPCQICHVAYFALVWYANTMAAVCCTPHALPYWTDGRLDTLFKKAWVVRRSSMFAQHGRENADLGRREASTLSFVQMEDRFKVECSDDVARTHIFTLIDQSIANMLASVGDTAHRIASNFRS